MNRFALVVLGCALSTTTLGTAFAQSGIISDDFNDPTLGSHWTHVDPLGDTSLALEGYGTEDARAVLSIPAGQDHDLWTGANHAPRLLQDCNNVDFEVEVKFDSPTVNAWTSQGIVVQESMGKLLRFEFLNRPDNDYLFEATAGDAPSAVLHQKVIAEDPSYMRVKRTGNEWCVTYSYDGVTWANCAVVTYDLTANQIGVHAISVNFGAPAHAFDSRVDYFFDTASPISPEDGPVDTEIPTANAGESRAIHAGDSVTLDGSGSADDTTATQDLIYQWTLLGRPSGSLSILTGADTISPTFTSDATGVYTVQLIVIDAAGFVSEPSLVEISSENLAPTAIAGSEQVVAIGETVILDGLDSFDPDGGAVQYAWSFTSLPAGSFALLMDADTATPSFVPDAPGEYVVQLIASDDFSSSDPDEVVVTAVGGNDLAIQKLRELACDLRWESNSKFAHRWHKRWIYKQLRHAARSIQHGHTLSAEWRLSRVLRRTDGYALRGAPDAFTWCWYVRPDVIIDQELQLRVYNAIVCVIDIIQFNN